VSDDGRDLPPPTGDTDQPESPPAPTRRRRALGLSTVLGAIIGVVAIAFVTRALVSEWSRVRDALVDASVPWLVAGLALAVAAMVSIALGWLATLRLLGDSFPRGRVVAWYFVGELGKYLPGGVWPVVGRAELARRGGIPRSRAYAGVALSLAVLYLAGMFVAVGFLPFALTGGSRLSPWMLFLVALPLGLLALNDRVLERLAVRVRRATGRQLPLDIPEWRHSTALVLRYLPSWFLIGGATYAVSRSLTTDVSFPRVMFAAVLSWVAGFLAVPVPAGAGVREAVFLAFAGLPAPLAATTAVATRLLFILVDAAGAGLSAPAAGFGRGRRRGKAPSPAGDEGTGALDRPEATTGQQ
jgi:uncharacterized membrane protein YbhN (UPF0104 family)